MPDWEFNLKPVFVMEFREGRTVENTSVISLKIKKVVAWLHRNRVCYSARTLYSIMRED